MGFNLEALKAGYEPNTTPVNTDTPTARVTESQDKTGTYNKTDRSYRKWCEACGGHLYNVHPIWGVIDVYAASIPGLKFKPAVHVNYQETVLPIRDGLPKFRDYPAEMGGSGALIPELAAA